jgi:hypothetical protein
MQMIGKQIIQYILIAVVGALIFFYIRNLHQLSDMKMLHDRQLSSLVDSSNRVTLTLKQDIEAYKQREAWLIDSAKAEGIKQGRIKSVHNVGVKIQYRDTGIIKVDTVYSSDTAWFEYL